jgi:hypothetical protein
MSRNRELVAISSHRTTSGHARDRASALLWLNTVRTNEPHVFAPTVEAHLAIRSAAAGDDARYDLATSLRPQLLQSHAQIQFLRSEQFIIESRRSFETYLSHKR